MCNLVKLKNNALGKMGKVTINKVESASTILKEFLTKSIRKGDVS